MEKLAELKEAGIYKEWWAPGAVVALMGFALTTMATGLHHAGFWGGAATLALALSFGGTAQFVGGVIELRKGHLFGGSAFCSYGTFWWGIFILLFILPTAGVPVGPMDKLGFLLVWTLFTFPFLWASYKHGRFLFILFLLLVIAFILLEITCCFPALEPIAGWETFIVGLLAWYIAGATLVNTEFKRTILPLK